MAFTTGFAIGILLGYAIGVYTTKLDNKKKKN